MTAISYKAFFGGSLLQQKKTCKRTGFLAIIIPCYQRLHCTHVCSKERQTLANFKAAHIMKSFAKKSHASFTWSFCKKSKTASPPAVFCKKIPKQLFTLCMKFLQKNPKQVFMNAFCTEVQSKVRELVIRLLQKSKAFFMRFLQGPKLFSFMKFLQNPKHFIHEVFAKDLQSFFFSVLELTLQRKVLKS